MEAEKARFVGSELSGRVLGVVGLGAIGVKVANAARALGMRVFGFDPHMTVEGAWQLSSDVVKPGAVLLNFARDGIVAPDALERGLAENRIARYVTDFPKPATLGDARVIALPHLGASTL